MLAVSVRFLVRSPFEFISGPIAVAVLSLLLA